MFDGEKNIIFLKKNVKEFIFNNPLPYTGEYKVCFQTTDGTSKKLSFDFEIEGTE